MVTAFREIKKTIQSSSTGNPNYPPHLHEAIEVMFIKAGRGQAYCNGENYPLEPGDFFLVFPNQIHAYSDFGPEGVCLLAIVNPALFPAYAGVFTEKVPTSPRYTTRPTDRNLIRMLEMALEEHAGGAPREVVESLLSATVGMLLERYALADSDTDRSCALRIAHYCREHYKEDLTVDRLSRELHISRSHISHTFSRRFKIRFPDYVNSLRLAEAVRLLEKGGNSITEVAHLAGFQTIRTFNRVFLQHYGIPLRQYLRQRMQPK